MCIFDGLSDFIKSKPEYRKRADGESHLCVLCDNDTAGGYGELCPECIKKTIKELSDNAFKLNWLLRHCLIKGDTNYIEDMADIDAEIKHYNAKCKSS